METTTKDYTVNEVEELKEEIEALRREISLLRDYIIIEQQKAVPGQIPKERRQPCRLRGKEEYSGVGVVD